jgi:hypothetical protein
VATDTPTGAGDDIDAPPSERDGEA